MNILTNNKDEVQVAEMERSLSLVAQLWESDAELSVDEMCEHLEAATAVIAGTSDFAQFSESFNRPGLERLN